MSVSRTSYQAQMNSAFADNTEESITEEVQRIDKTSLSDSVVFIDDDDTIGGNKTFTNVIVASTAPTLSTHLTNKAYVDASFAANDAMVYKGTVGSGGTIEIAAIEALSTYNAGWTYKVITASTIFGNVCEIGDLLMCIVDRTGAGDVDADWVVTQTNIDGAIISSSSVTDNTLIRGNGGGQGVQDSGIVVDDSDNVSNLGTVGCGAITSTSHITYQTGIPTAKSSDYTLVEADNGKIIEVNGAYDVILPSTNLGAGFTCQIVNIGSGTVTLDRTTNTKNIYSKVNSSGNVDLSLENQYGGCTLYARGSDYVVIGDLT